MNERRPPSLERRLPIRRFFKIVGGVALAASLIGVKLDEPSFDIETVTVKGEAGEVQLLLTDGIENCNGGSIDVTPEGKIRFETSDTEFFYPGREYQYIHRANDIKAIDDAWDEGAEVFDIDLNHVGEDLYAEHGIIPQLKVGIGGINVAWKFPAVIDSNEGEFKLGMPAYTYDQLVAHISYLANLDRPLAISGELKRGEFDAETLIKILDINRKYGVPVILHSPDKEQLYSVGCRVAQTYAAGLER